MGNNKRFRCNGLSSWLPPTALLLLLAGCGPPGSDPVPITAAQLDPAQLNLTDWSFTVESTGSLSGSMTGTNPISWSDDEGAYIGYVELQQPDGFWQFVLHLYPVADADAFIINIGYILDGVVFGPTFADSTATYSVELDRQSRVVRVRYSGDMGAVGGTSGPAVINSVGRIELR
jgi:hypothetical protein